MISNVGIGLAKPEERLSAEDCIAETLRQVTIEVTGDML
jgi:hypothetical protein